MKEKIGSTLLLFMTAIIWGFAFVAQVVGTEKLGCFTFNGVRFAVGTVSLIPVILIFDRKKLMKGEIKKLISSGIICGLLLCTASNLQQIGTTLTGSAGHSGFITGLYTVLTPLLGIFFGRKCRLMTIIGAVTAVIGLYLLSITDGLSSIGIGDIVLFIGAFFWALHILAVDKLASGLSALKFSFVQFVVCTVICFAGMFIFDEVVITDIIGSYVPILYAGVLSVGVAYTCQTIGQRKANPAFAAIIFSTESIFGAIGGAVILGERMTPRGYIGSGLIFTGIILSQLHFRKKEQTEEEKA